MISVLTHFFENMRSAFIVACLAGNDTDLWYSLNINLFTFYLPLCNLIGQATNVIPGNTNPRDSSSETIRSN
jgi:hypothetical protein